MVACGRIDTAGSRSVVSLGHRLVAKGAGRGGQTMRLRASLAAVVALVLVVAVAPEANGGGGTPITVCGQVVTTNAFLTQNLHCPGSAGVVVGADGITIDLKGFRLRGNVTNYGIDNNGFDGVTIRNGTVRNFDFGVSAYGGADKFTVQNLVVSGCFNYGIAVLGNSAKIQSSNLSGNTHFGILVTGDSAAIQSVTATRNGGQGITVHGNSESVKSSTSDGNDSFGIVAIGNSAKITASAASGNVLEGIRVDGDAAKVTGNQTDGNGFDVGVSDLSGLGIDVTGYTTAPSGTNIASGNDDLADCSPAFLC